MASKSRYFSAYPTINPSYLSGGTGRNENNNTFMFQDIVTPTKKAKGTNVIVQTNIDYDVFSFKDSNFNDVIDPIETKNFNVIRVSVDSNNILNRTDKEFFVDILQGQSKDNLTVSYTTPLKTKDVFFRSYPVKNNFCNVRFRNNTVANVYINHDISLSKFSQFNPPSQLGDNVQFKEMTNLTRIANEFYDDVSREQFANSKIINRFGYFKNNVDEKQIVAPVEILENTSNTFVELFGVSDDNSDVFEFAISGETDVLSVGRIDNSISLLGTTNSAITLNRYKYIDTINMPQTNTGNVSVFKSGTNELVAYIPADTRALSSPLYYINKIEEGVLKEVKVRGQTIIQNGAIDVRLATGSNIETIWTTGVLDGIVDNTWCPDFKIPQNSTVYAIARDLNTTAHSNQRVDVSLKILKYNLQPLTSISDSV
jgi:hypothetical protein